MSLLHWLVFFCVYNTTFTRAREEKVITTTTQKDERLVPLVSDVSVDIFLVGLRKKKEEDIHLYIKHIKKCDVDVGQNLCITGDHLTIFH